MISLLGVYYRRAPLYLYNVLFHPVLLISLSCIEGQSSSMSRCDVDGVIAAFCHLEEFALRLLAEPWRPEYRLLKLYNNLFVTSILPFVADAPKIFTSLGRCF